MSVVIGSLNNIEPRLSPIQLLLLVLLEHSPKYGYEMLKKIKDELSGIWEPKTGTIYPALKSLEKHGLIEIKIDEGVDFYYITNKGRDVLLGIGLRQSNNLRFICKYISTVAKWMSPQFKNSFLKSMQNITPEDSDPVGIMISMLDDDVDRELRLRILTMTKTLLEKRLETVTSLITTQEGEPQ